MRKLHSQLTFVFIEWQEACSLCCAPCKVWARFHFYLWALCWNIATILVIFLFFLIVLKKSKICIISLFTCPFQTTEWRHFCSLFCSFFHVQLPWMETGVSKLQRELIWLKVGIKWNFNQSIFFPCFFPCNFKSDCHNTSGENIRLLSGVQGFFSQKSTDKTKYCPTIFFLYIYIICYIWMCYSAE